MKTISIFNRKGGVGKTSISTALAVFFGEIGKKVLFLDLDSQMNASEFLTGFNSRNDIVELFDYSITDVIEDPDFDITKAIYPAGNWNYDSENDELFTDKEFENLFFIPGSKNVDEKSKEIFSKPELFGQFRLQNQLRKIDELFDMCIIDCPPSESPITVAALVASSACMSPSSPDQASTNGLEMCREMIKNIHIFSPGLKDLGCFLNNYKSRESVSQFIKETLEENEDIKFSGITIRSASRVPYAFLMREGLISSERYLNGLPQTQKVSEDLIGLAEYILENI